MAYVPIFNDAVADTGVGVVVGSGPAGLHEQLRVGDGLGGLYLHEDHLLEVNFHRVAAGVHLSSEVLTLKEFKLEGESTKAFLSEGVRVFVREPQSQVGSLWI